MENSTTIENNQLFGRTKRNYYLALLTLGYTFNHVDRQILGVLIEPIKAEFSLSDSQIGLLSGIFAFPYILIGLPLATLADRSDRRRILAGCLALWSAMTAACAAAGNFAHLLLFRLGVGAGESGAHPISMSVISDLFPPERRSGAIGIYGIGTSLGALISFSIGGWVAQAYDWRSAFLVVGLPGVLLAVLMLFTMKEPERGLSEGRRVAEAKGMAHTLGFMWSQPSVRNHMAAMAMFVMAYVSLLIWLAPFFVRTHGMTIGEIGLLLGVIFGVIGGLGSVLGGLLADRVTKNNIRRLPLFIGATYLACAPAALAGLAAPTQELALFFFGLWAFCSGLGTGPQFSLLQGLVGLRMRVVANAALGVVLNLSAFYGGPQLTGILSDLWAAQYEQNSLRAALAVMCCLYFGAFAFCLFTARTIERDTLRACTL